MWSHPMEPLEDMVDRVFFKGATPASCQELINAYTLAYNGQIATMKGASREYVCDYLIERFSDDADLISENFTESMLLRLLDVIFDYTRRCVRPAAWERLRHEASQKHRTDAELRRRRVAYDTIARCYLEHAYRPSSRFAERAATHFWETASVSKV